MDRDLLITNLLTAARETIPYAQAYIIEQLPEKYQLYRLNRNLPARGWKRNYLGPFSAEEIIDHYWRKPLHPAWLSAEVVELVDDCCMILVDSEGQWTDNDERMMAIAQIRKNAHPPFSCAISMPPPRVVRDGKFSINWRQHYRTSVWDKLKFYVYSSPLYARYFKWRYPKL